MNWLRSPGSQVRSWLPNLRCGSQQNKPILGKVPTRLVLVQTDNVPKDARTASNNAGPAHDSAKQIIRDEGTG